jgi:hypothetical protein
MESNAIFKIDKQGTSSLFMEVPKARYLNSWVFVRPGIFLICDSYGGAIWQLNVKNATMTEWLRNDLLATKNMIPGQMVSNSISTLPLCPTQVKENC